MQYLIDKGENVNTVGWDGTTLALAAIRGKSQSAELLLRNGANPLIKTKGKILTKEDKLKGLEFSPRTPAQWATKKGYFELSVLIKRHENKWLNNKLSQ